jgi:hypothetical protein
MPIPVIGVGSASQFIGTFPAVLAFSILLAAPGPVRAGRHPARVSGQHPLRADAAVKAATSCQPT